MAQFDVHRNLGKSQAQFPLLVIVQSGLLRGWHRRIVVPLARADRFDAPPDPQLNPVIEIDGVAYVVAAHEIANVPLSSLGPVVADLRDRASTVIGAIDWALGQGFG
ncbi:MAG TPA: CcdB family protein [Alphaproteobacteria bacterium]|nr:CcdB family protein [Alphaproteobacteria bacterium]